MSTVIGICKSILLPVYGAIRLDIQEAVLMPVLLEAGILRNISDTKF